MDFNSEFFDTAQDLVNEKNNLVRIDHDRREREAKVRAFYNGKPTMTEEEAEKAGREEVTNHLMGHKAIAKLEARIYQAYAGNYNGLADIKVDTDNPSVDADASLKLSQIVSEMIKNSSLFKSLWRSVSGELNITGRAPLLFDSHEGLFPKMAPNLLLPKGSPITSSEVTYAFNPKELSIVNLERLKSKAGVPGDSDSMIDGVAISMLIDTLKDQIKTNSKTTGSGTSLPTGGHEESDSVVDDGAPGVASKRKITVDAWWYYEPRRADDGSIKVSATLFHDSVNFSVKRIVDGKETEETRSLDSNVIAHIPDLLDSANGWLQLMVLDSEIGGVKNYDNTRGIAELSFNSDMDTEELFNVMIEGDKMRALPRFQKEEGANEDDILDWNPDIDTIVPDKLREFRISGNAQHLVTPIGMLMQNSAGITADTASNLGKQQQLRVQAISSQSLAQEMERIRMEDVYCYLDTLLAEVVHRLLNVEHSPKASGYEDIMWARAQIDRAGYDRLKLGERSHGRFNYLKVRARRLDGSGQADQEAQVASFLLSNLGVYPAQSRPYIIKRATSIITKDPDFANEVTKLPEVIITQQNIIAENEWDTIERRAILGKPLPVNDNDIDHDHLPTHLVDLKAHVERGKIRKWDNIDIAIFEMAQEHMAEHLKRMLASNISNKEATQWLRPFQQLTAEAIAMIDQLQAEFEQQGKGIDPIESRKLDQRDRELDLKEVDTKIKISESQGQERQRQSRTNIAERQQSLQELEFAQGN